MRVLLVFAAYEHLSKVTSAPFPLGLGYLASYLVSKNIDVAIADLRYGSRERFKKILVEYRPEIVGISCMTPNQNEAYNTARTVRKILGKSLVIMGGVHATFMYDQILQNVREIDAVVIGEGEITLWELCREWSESKSVDKFYHINGIAFRKNGTVVVTPPRERIDQLDELPYPAFDRV
ncbi:MAG: cobalamin-dependent protein, partial [Clostridia bacterium]|nr:cobalamin-dependent protein [Clostridia bacterium]